METCGPRRRRTCSIYPFVDGNKRVGTTAALVLLRSNGFTVETDEDALSAFVLAVIEGLHDEAALAAYQRRYAKP